MGDVLTEMKRAKDYLVCIDSDGCLLDNMELKHKECFCPAVVNAWNLQGASKYVREVHEWVNLYSRSRGWNRFPAVVRTLELSYARPELKERGYKLPDLSPLKKWISETPVLSAVAIDEYAKANPDCDPLLLQAAQWSREVDANIAKIVRGILPFPGVKEALVALQEFADIVVVSATPHDALVRELASVGISPFMTAIAGQELGTKSQCIKKAMSHGYKPDHVLKIGDAPSDYKAAQDNGVLFFPIVAGDERNSWNNVRDTAAKKLKEGTFEGEYQQEILKGFFAALAEEPNWKIK